MCSHAYTESSIKQWLIDLLKIQRIKQEAEETEKLLKERIQKLEMTRLELEEEICRQKNALATERVQAEEQLSTLKQRLKHEEVCICTILCLLIYITNIFPA